MKSPEPHPLEGQIGEPHRTHFYQNEKRGHESERGEGKYYDTRLSRLIQKMNDTLEHIPERKREIFKKMVDAISRASLSYIDSRIGLIKASQSQDKQLKMEADRARRFAHLRLVDSIRIACRNLASNVEGWTVDTDVAELVGESENPRVRDVVAAAAIDFVWELLDKEDALRRKR